MIVIHFGISSFGFVQSISKFFSLKQIEFQSICYLNRLELNKDGECTQAPSLDCYRLTMILCLIPSLLMVSLNIKDAVELTLVGTTSLII